MDARSFGDFLIGKMKEASTVIENNLKNVAYTELSQGHRAAGQLSIFDEITAKMGNLLDDFFAQQNGTTPPSDTSSTDASNGGAV